MLFVLLLAALPDSPRTFVMTPEPGGLVVAAVPSSLIDARKMVDQLRYEEAVVEYQRYLATPERPVAERAAALLELGFVHLVLGDDANAEARALEALDLDPELTVPASAPAKQVAFVDRMRKLSMSRARLTLAQRDAGDPPYVVRVNVVDPEGRVSRVLLRHALTATGPYYSAEMKCEGEVCRGVIPPPKDSPSFTAWYFVEALDEASATAARVASPESPLQLAIVDEKPWYTSPVTWGVAGAVLVGVATVIYFLSPPPPQ